MLGLSFDIEIDLQCAVQNIDELFGYPQFTAAVDIGGVLNTGVFVAEPNAETYKDIMATYEKAPSYNKGDQGFLNYYFNKTANPLPGNYNLMIKFTVSSARSHHHYHLADQQSDFVPNYSISQHLPLSLSPRILSRFYILQAKRSLGIFTFCTNVNGEKTTMDICLACGLALFAICALSWKRAACGHPPTTGKTKAVYQIFVIIVSRAIMDANTQRITNLPLSSHLTSLPSTSSI